MKRMLLLLFILLLSVPLLRAQDADVSGVFTPPSGAPPIEALWDTLANYDVDARIAVAQGYGVVWTGSFYLISQFNAPTMHKLDGQGNYLGPVTITGTPLTSTQGFRDMEFHNGFLYGSPNNNVIHKVDVATMTHVSTLTLPTGTVVRGLAYDPVRDGFWASTFGGNISCYSATTGALIPGAVLTNSDAGKHGLAYDNRNPNGPLLWVAYEATSPTQIGFRNYNLTTLTLGESYLVTIPNTTGAPNLAAGGMDIVDDLYAGKLTMLHLTQGTPDRLTVFELQNLDAGVLQPFNLTAPAAGTVVTSVPNSTTPVTITWDTSRAGASYKWIFGSPTVPPRLLTFPAGSNSLTLTLGQIDQLLAENGVPPGGSVVGQWDVWAFRGNLPDNDSLKAANGPRAITLQRALPALTPFALSNPANNSTVVTSVFNGTPVNINWRKSGDGVTYKWKFGTGLKGVNAVVLTLPANGGGYDTALTVINNQLDAVLGTLGVNPGDSISGQWAVWAYNGLDSLRSTDVFNITFKRQGKGDVLIAYDSASVACRASKDSVSAWLNGRGISFDLFNRGTNTSTNAISFRGYKKVLFIGEGTSSMSIRQKDSLKAYLSNPPQGQRSRAAIFSEDIGYNYGRSASTYYDLDFVNNWLGWNFVLDRPSTGAAQGLVGSHINFNIPDSTVGSWPDVISRFDPNTTHDLYKFRGDGATNAVGKVGATYTIVTFGVDLESLRPAIDGPGGSPIGRFLDGAFQYLDTDGTIPVELTSFKGSVDAGVVRLEWTTATEVNNSGFEIERKNQNGTFMNIGFKPGFGTTSEPKAYSFTDNSVTAGTYTYRLKQVDHDGTFSYSPEVEVDVTAPAEFSLSQNYPNPFNPSTTIKFGLRVESRVSLKIFNTLGQEVMLLINENREAGVHSLSFDASKLSSGVYFYKIEANGVDGSTFAETKKMILTK